MNNNNPPKTYYIEETRDGVFNVFSRTPTGFGDKFAINYIGGYDTREGAEALIVWCKERSF